MILKRKCFTKWDETDRLKQMKDSDILAEKKKTRDTMSAVSNYTSKTLGNAATGAGIGAAAGAILGSGFKGRLRSAGKIGMIGAGIGAGVGMLRAANQQSKEAADRSFYNKRLGYAQKQAKRREKKDWKTNMTQRDGYSY